jgi:hypothetical protein
MQHVHAANVKTAAIVKTAATAVNGRQKKTAPKQKTAKT